MKFLVISQRTPGLKDFDLRNLTGHGRIDVILRCILGSQRTINKEKGDNTIYCFLKGDENHLGWLKYSDQIDKEDEISLAFKIQTNWDEYFSHGNITDLLDTIGNYQRIFLTEGGKPISNNEFQNTEDLLFILGAQSDLTDVDLDIINPKLYSSLSNQPMLASHAIIYMRELMANW